MQTINMRPNQRTCPWLWPGLLAAVMLLLCSLAPAWAGKGNADNPKVIPPQASPGGLTYGDWGGEWWKWVYAAPLYQDPITDPDGRYGSARQNGSVWFLAGGFGETVVRNITIPTGKKLFFPIVNVFNDYPCTDPNFKPKEGQTLEQFLAEGAAFYIDHVTQMSVTVDGVALNNLWNYRGISGLTTFIGDPSWVAMDPCITGGSQVGVADGYWIMLAPLQPGQHTIRFTAAEQFPDGATWSLDVTYHITVSPSAK